MPPSPSDASPGAGPMAPQSHLQHVEGLRAVAAGVVVLNHAFAQVWHTEHPLPLPRFLWWLQYSMIAGHLSVTVFIVISGFCLTLPVVKGGGNLRGGVREFFKRRARRILPPYYGAVGFALILIWTIIGKPTGSLWDVPIRTNPTSIVSHLLLLQNFFATGSINYVFWSIAVEWQIYFLFPILVWAWRRYGPRWTVPVAMVSGYAIFAAFQHTRVERAACHYVGLFTLGMLAAYLASSAAPAYVRARERVPWRTGAVAAFAVVVALTLGWGWPEAHEHFPILDFPVGLGAMCLLVTTSRPGGSVLTRAFAWRPLAFVGTFSYSLYLIHAPLLQILWQYVLVPIGVGPLPMFFLLWCLGLPVILAVSYAFYRVFEEPFMSRSPKRDRVRVGLAPIEANARSEQRF